MYAANHSGFQPTQYKLVQNLLNSYLKFVGADPVRFARLFIFFLALGHIKNNLQ